MHQVIGVQTGSVDLRALIADQLEVLDGLRHLALAVTAIAEEGAAQLAAVLEQIDVELN